MSRSHKQKPHWWDRYAFTEKKWWKIEEDANKDKNSFIRAQVRKMNVSDRRRGNNLAQNGIELTEQQRHRAAWYD